MAEISECISEEYHVDPHNFELLFLKRSGLERIKQDGIEGALSSYRNRYMIWRILLGIFPFNQTIQHWIQRANELRKKYTEFQNDIVVIYRQPKLDQETYHPLLLTSDVLPKQRTHGINSLLIKKSNPSSEEI